MEIAFWELLLDVTGLILCAAAVVCLVRWRAAAREMAALRALTGQEREFFESMLRQYMDSPKPASMEADAPAPEVMTASGSPDSPVRFRDPGVDGKSGAPSGENPYDALRRMAAEGHEAADIAARLSLPRREVELALKLRRKVDGYYREHPGEVGALL